MTGGEVTVWAQRRESAGAPRGPAAQVRCGLCKGENLPASTPRRLQNKI
jgi:hypothetical protein